MANKKHLEILKQGVEIWNKWRENNPDVRPILKKADLSGLNLQEANLSGANLLEADLTTNLIEADFSNAYLRGANLSSAELTGANLIGANLSETNLLYACLWNANITGANLFGTARDAWIIKGIRCEYIYFDPYPYDKKSRIPKGRNFRPGEFEKLYKQLPTVEYYFEHGFTPIDTIIMDKVIQAINEKYPEFELRLDSFHSRGQPHAVFTVLHKEHVSEAHRQITESYERIIKNLEAERDRLWELNSRLIENPGAINHYHIDVIDVKAGKDVVLAKDKGRAEIKNG